MQYKEERVYSGSQFEAQFTVAGMSWQHPYEAAGHILRKQREINADVQFILSIPSKALISPRDGGTTFKVNFPPQLNLSEKAPIDVPEVCLC